MNSLPYEIKLTYIIAIIIMLLLVGFILIVVLIYNKKQLLYQKEKQLREAEHQNDLLKEELKRRGAIQKERERISHDMHDELGAGISALKLQVEFLRQKTTDRQSQKDIEELLDTAESMNLSMREMLWSLNSENDNLGNFVQYLCNYAVDFFQKTNIEVICQHTKVDAQKVISSESRRNMLLCIKEALNNIYKHAQATQVNIDFYHSKEAFSVEIKDDGTGLPPNIESGNGLRNMEHRMSSIGGVFQIISSRPGLYLKFSLPVID